MTEQKSAPTALFLMFLFVIMYTLWSGFVLLTLWDWFAFPIGLPHLSYVEAMGIALLTRFLTRPSPGMLPKNMTEEDDFLIRFAIVQWTYGILYPLFTLVIGWTLHLYL
jgi:hypothetical protein